MSEECAEAPCAGRALQSAIAGRDTARNRYVPATLLFMGSSPWREVHVNDLDGTTARIRRVSRHLTTAAKAASGRNDGSLGVKGKRGSCSARWSTHACELVRPAWHLGSDEELAKRRRGNPVLLRVEIPIRFASLERGAMYRGIGEAQFCWGRVLCRQTEHHHCRKLRSSCIADFRS